MMARVTVLSFVLLVLLLLGMRGVSLVQHNWAALDVKRTQGERLTAWGEGRGGEEAGGEEAGGEGCALLPWLTNFPQLAALPTHCPATELTDLWSARQMWLAGDVEAACLFWRRWDAWVEPRQLLDQSVSAAAWADVPPLLACLESWPLGTRDSTAQRTLYNSISRAYWGLGDSVRTTDHTAARAHYAAADRWDVNQQWQGTSATARLLIEQGDLDAALALLQGVASDATVTVAVRYRLWLEAAALLAPDAARHVDARAAYDAARRLRPDQIAPYTGLAALYRNSQPAWSVAALQAGLDSPAGVAAVNRRTLLRQLGDVQRAQAAWQAAACAYQAALAQPIPQDTERTALQQAINEMETRLGQPARCDGTVGGGE